MPVHIFSNALETSHFLYSLQNVHLEEGFIHVLRAWKELEEIGAPKWDHVRSVPFLLFSDRIVKRLEELKEQSIRIAPTDLVFCYDDG